MPLWSILAFWGGITLIMIYEFYAYSQEKKRPGETISEWTWRISTTHPLVPFAMGILMGHFFWQSTAVYLNHCK